MLTLTVNGKPYRCELVDLFSLSIGESRTIKRETGMSITVWLEKLQDFGDPDVLASVLYLVLSRAGEVVEWSELDDMSLTDVMRGFALTDEPDVVDAPPVVADPAPAQPDDLATEPDAPAELALVEST